MDNAFVIFFLLQVFIVAVLLWVFKNILNTLLIDAALEQLHQAVRPDADEAPREDVTVVTSGEAPTALRRRIESALQNRSINVSYRVAPAIQGGVVLQLGDDIIDFSMKSRLKYLFSSHPDHNANNF